MLTGDFNSVNVSLIDAGRFGQNVRHFVGGHVFPFPTEGVADAVDEIQMVIGVAAYQVSRVEIGVSLLRNNPRWSVTK